MGIFNKNKSSKVVQRQELNKKEDNNFVFLMHLLMKEKCEMPSKEEVMKIIEKHLGQIECYNHDSKSFGFAAKEYLIETKDKTWYPQLMFTECIELKKDIIDEFTKSQMWDCKNKDKILSECGYQVIAVDMFAFEMDYKKRAEMLMDYMEALIELYPSCEAIQFLPSGKMFAREQIINHNVPKEDRFIHFAVNVRFFNIQNSEDKIIDTLGMNLLGLPDLQYHFHNVDPNYIVNHAYNIASYIFDNNNPIKDNDTIDGIKDGKISMDVQWKCHYENSIIEPKRPVIDIYMNENASGKR